jgi:hypothetical protein
MVFLSMLKYVGWLKYKIVLSLKIPENRIIIEELTLMGIECSFSGNKLFRHVNITISKVI